MKKRLEIGLLMLSLVACSPARPVPASPAASQPAQAVSSLAPATSTTQPDTQTPIKWPTTVPTQTTPPKSTKTITPRPTIFGTPASHYGSIPIPPDAISGMDTVFQYQFSSRRSNKDICDYYNQNLSSTGWKINFTSAYSCDEADVTKFFIDLVEVDGPGQAVIMIERLPGDDLSYVVIAFYSTD
jgi:hypothetical protein